MREKRREDDDVDLLRELLIERQPISAILEERNWNTSFFENWALQFLSNYQNRHEYLIMLYSRGNPVLAYSLCDLDSLSGFSTRLLRFMESAPGKTLYGDPERVKASHASAGISNAWPVQQVEPVHHVFPVYSDWLKLGLMVPFSVEPATDDWQISDAFAAFALDKHTAKDAQKTFMQLLQRIEAVWSGLGFTSAALPLRWRKPFKFQVLIPVHTAAIEGESLQVPLVVAIVRALAALGISAVNSDELPFGNKPVFSTGVLGEDDAGPFLPVLSVDKKLEGFIREYDAGNTAFLTDEQIQAVKTVAPELLRQVQVIRVENLEQLLSLDGIREGLQALCNTPHPTELDAIVTNMGRLRHIIRFNDIENIANWLLPNLHSPVYRFEILRQAGLMQSHGAHISTALKRFSEAAELVHNSPASFGVEQHIRLATAWGVAAYDVCQPGLAEPYFETVTPLLEYASAYTRAEFYGQLSQLYRQAGRWDDAVDAGYESVTYADMGRAGDAGQDRNYLVHALIARARAKRERFSDDLDTAERVLEASLGPCLPALGKAKRDSHVGFCRHLEAEIARLREVPYDLGKLPAFYHGDWGHGVWFAAMACARNPRIELAERVKCARYAAGSASQRMGEDPFSIYRLFYFVYSAYLSCLEGEDPTKAHDAVLEFCRLFAEKGLRGWLDRLQPALDVLPERGLEGAEALCLAVPYH